MTQITRKSTPRRGPVLLLAPILAAGLVLTGCGDDDTATTPAPAPPPPAPATPEPEPPAPEAPATPTGLIASATVDSITWTWDSVEGAAMYAIQVSMDEMFDDTDKITMTTETSHTESGLEPETSLYARVAAAAGTMEDPVQGAWTTHVTGMSSMTPPPPPPAAPDPVMVSFSWEKGTPLMPDKSQVKEKAMATVNPDITVTSNTMAVIEPMGFAEGASPLSLSAGENMPFKFVDWKVLQSTVVGDGVTFKITRQTLGANQEMTPTGDVAYVTCGPFECGPGMDAPMLRAENSAVCADWNPDVRLEVGVISPGASRLERDAGQNASVGLDLGWTYTSTADTKIKFEHDFRSFKVPGGTTGKGTEKALPAGRPPYDPDGGGSATPEAGRRNIVAGSQSGFNSQPTGTATPWPNTVIGVDGCYPQGITPGVGVYDLYKDRTSLGPVRHAQCFRLSVGVGGNYLNNYSVKLTPETSSVSWGENKWDAFDDLKCDQGTTFEATEYVNKDLVCELLEDEVDTLKLRPHPAVPGNDRFGAPNTGPVAYSTVWRDAAQVLYPGARLQGMDLYFDVKPTRWTHLYYYDVTATGGRITGATKVEDLYDNTPTQSFSRDEENRPGRLTGQDSFNEGSNALFFNRWIPLHTYDEKYAGNAIKPMFGDLGKVDAHATTGGDDKPENYTTGSSSRCTADDGGKPRSSPTANDGTLCDAVDVKIPTSVTFTDGMGFDCKVKKEYTLTCQWDSSGGGFGNDTIGFTRGTALTANNPGRGPGFDPRKFIHCEVEEN